jgi:RNA polymerase sigma factor (sigma-70 family)
VNEDSARFAAIVLPHLADAHSLARWLTRDRTEAEDIVQEACLKALRGFGGYAGGNPRAWLLAIVRNLAFDRFGKRREEARMTNIEDADAAGALVADETPETAHAHASASERLRAAIAALSPHLREAFILRETHQLAYSDIARVTGVPIGTVMSRLSRARARLVEALAGDLA